MLPPLELSTRPQQIPRPPAVRASGSTVTDVGVPVAGATVRAGGKQTTTTAGQGVLLLRGPAGGGRITADTRKTDYARDGLTLTVRRSVAD